MQSDGLTRRALIGGALVGLTGCSGVGVLTPPTPGTTASRPGTLPSSTPTPDASLVTAAAQEADGGWYAAMAKQATAWKAPSTFAPWCRAAAATRDAHASLLSRHDPLSGENGDLSSWFTPTPHPPAAPASLKAALTAIQTRETALATEHRTRALSASDPSMVALWASLATSAHSRRAPGPLPPTTTVTPAPIEAPGLTEALDLLLAHVHVLIAGMEVGLGTLPIRDAHYTPGRARLLVIEQMRDTTVASLRAAQATPDAPALSYELVKMTTPASIIQAWGNLEVKVLEAWAAVAVASNGADRGQAIDAMFAQADAATGYGVGLSAWPGWA